MNGKPPSGIPETLLATLRAFQESRTILTAIELDLFTATGDGSTAAEVAAKIGCDARATEMLMNALVASELLVKDGGRFRNTEVSARFFVAGAAEDSRAAMMHLVTLWRTWSTLTECVRGGTAVGHRELAVRGDDWTEPFIAAMHRGACERAPLVVETIGARGVSRMIDIGGGSGAYAIAFAEANPELRAEVFDLATVTPITLRHIAASGVADRVSTRVGDLRRDSFGEGYDLVFLSAICHMLGVDENRDLLQRCRQAAAPGGRVVIQDFILTADKTSPKFGALFALNMLVGTEGGASYSDEEYRAWLEEAGFRDVSHVGLPGPAGLMIGVG